ncbi:hypothetical protein EVAR_81006_1 [Eumeta japonica]|uniref:Uncharacterized protein n=1 Tax=Eumeta variegata TaxID=151549 RepID=A0A4C1T6F1_EUMVA|nr:hypothetical protein EVAR_81006_1 [Eumeta japonica]
MTKILLLQSGRTRTRAPLARREKTPQRRPRRPSRHSASARRRPATQHPDRYSSALLAVISRVRGRGGMEPLSPNRYSNVGEFRKELVLCPRRPRRQASVGES